MKKFALPSIEFEKVTTGLQEFWNWWKTELSDLLPATLKSGLAFPKNTLSAQFGKKGVTLSEAKPKNGNWQRPEHPGKKGKAPTPCVDYDQINVSLGSDIIFSQALTLPKVGDRDLRDIISLKIERLVPLKKNEVRFAYRAEEHGEGKELSAELFVVKTRDIDSFFKIMEKNGIRTRAVQFHPEESSSTRFQNIHLSPVLRRNLTVKDFLKRPVLVSLLFWMLIFLGVLGGLLGYEARLQGTVETLRNEVAGKIAIIESFEAQVAREKVIAKAFSDYRALAILDELSRLLPAGAWVEDFSLDNGRITINGYYKDPADIVEALEASAFFQNVAMPSVSSGGAGQETSKFRISLEFETRTGGRT